mgnify:CR=1 FL=1
MRVEGQILNAWVLTALLMTGSIAGAQSLVGSTSQQTATTAAPVAPAEMCGGPAALKSLACVPKCCEVPHWIEPTRSPQTL